MYIVVYVCYFMLLMYTSDGFANIIVFFCSVCCIFIDLWLNFSFLVDWIDDFCVCGIMKEKGEKERIEKEIWHNGRPTSTALPRCPKTEEVVIKRRERENTKMKRTLMVVVC